MQPINQFTIIVSTSATMSIFSRFYRPYLFKDSVDQAYYHRSVRDNPLFRHYEAVTRLAAVALHRLRAKRMLGKLSSDDKYMSNRDWFYRMAADLPFLIERVRIERYFRRSRIEAGTILHRTLFLCFSMLEVTCSLLIYAMDRRYCQMTDSQVENLRFPLSSWSRENIRYLTVSTGTLVITGYF